ncbi:tumor necrosis factor, alpha-induced protein 8-like protein 2 A isoform X2 [Plutella xylostella]|uniref:tumor necrosis factor, alpha-induced protein 8-like protein 2 A isoform X1 n=1 Tax=Plutella xylostella TaxID=51655 RepID=UPI002032768A|nr:tumor necrosis factor, alpha-induced protein 8-like protein 2 A isoform X1 [Plutella xylostella]XP_048484537.1 tumor necrosis factor, alpha-induced protein 8-like protein 2 A isoform X2 [Plutella xylostella]
MVSTSTEGGGGSWCARDISLRAQKKFLSRVGGAASARALVLDDQAAKLLDQFLCVLRSRVERREAERLVKHVIKAAVKLGVLRRHQQLSAPDERALAAFRSKFHTVLMAVVSFCEVEFSYDRGFLQDALRDSHQSLKSVVERHLSDKSVSRLAGIFSLVSRPELLDSLFAGKVDDDVLKLSRMLRKELDKGVL